MVNVERTEANIAKAAEGYSDSSSDRNRSSRDSRNQRDSGNRRGGGERRGGSMRIPKDRD